MGLDHILDSLKEKIISQSQEGFYSPGNYSQNEYREFRYSLQSKLRGKDLDTLFQGQACSNSEGCFYSIISEESYELSKPDLNFCQNELLKQLSFLPGVRGITEKKLKEQGFNKFEDLVSHPRFSKNATRINKILRRKNVQEILALCDARFPKTDLVYLLLSGFFPLRDFIFLDLETLGLFPGNIIFLAALAEVKAGVLKISQYLARSPGEEGAVLKEVLKKINKSRVLVTYNGKSFDWPFLEQRAFLNNFQASKPLLHLDLLHFARRNFKVRTDKFNLTNIEVEVLKKERGPDLPGQYMPLLYKEYLVTKEAGYLFPLILHNKNDIISLVELLNLFYRAICP